MGSRLRRRLLCRPFPTPTPASTATAITSATAATTEDTATLTATEPTAATMVRLQPKPTTLCVQRESLTNVESHKNKDVKNQKQVLKKKFLGLKKKKKKKKK